MSDKLFIARAGLAELQPGSALAAKARIPFLVLSFVGMALGLVGSCNTEMNGIHIAHAAMNTGAGVDDLANNRITRWQVKAYGQALVSDPDRILKLTGREIAYTLAAPGLERKDLPTIVWQYRADACVLDIYFKTNGSDNALDAKAVHYEIRDLEGRDVAENASCIQTVVAAASQGRGDLQLAMAE